MPLAVGWLWLIFLVAATIGFGLFKFKAMKTLIAIFILLVLTAIVATAFVTLGFSGLESILERWNLLTITWLAAGGYIIGSFLSWITG